jgi:Zn-finger nucleic acid-binding protein
MLARMNCRNCGAPMRPAGQGDHFVCDHCASFHFPEQSQDGVRSTGEPTDLTCPVCRASLAAGFIRRHQVLSCPGCQGVLVRSGSLAVLVDELRARHAGPRLPPQPLDPEALGRTLGCPGCGQPMELHPYYGPGRVLIDTCGACRWVWLDRGEIATISRS